MPRGIPKSGKRKTGGARPGAGRPALPADEKRQPFSVRLLPWAASWLKEQPGKPGEVIEAALASTYGIGQGQDDAIALIRTAPSQILTALATLDDAGRDPFADKRIRETWQDLVQRLAER